MNRWSARLLPLCALALGLAGHAGAAGTFITIDPPGASTRYPGSFAVAINASGTIAGYYTDTNLAWHGYVRSPAGVYTEFQVNGLATTVAGINASGAITGSYFDTTTHAFVRSPTGVITTFDAPGAGTASNQGSSGANINDAGVIVGYFLDGSNLTNGFLRAANGAITVFDAPAPAHTTTASSINTSGTIAGNWSEPSDYFHGFVRSTAGVITTFDAPDEGTGFIQGTGSGLQVHSQGAGNCINDAGAITGYYIDSADHVHGYVRTPSGVITEFSAPGAGTGGGRYPNNQGTWGESINGPGAITGYYIDSSTVTHAFLRSADGVITPFDAPGALNTWAYSINDAGAIVGFYNDGSNVYHGFLLTFTTPMADFSIQTLVVNKYFFEEAGTFDLGAGGVSFDPISDPFTLTFGTASVVIPAGSFKRLGSTGTFYFAGTVNGVSMLVDIQAQNKAATRYGFSILATGLDLTGQKEPMSVGLQMGENTGSTVFKAIVF